ncbi:MAG: response regulator transcription factor [Armatimonadetes bacterium]|nr:response regulator transcription factor [Armatimonadota bacterium]
MEQNDGPIRLLIVDDHTLVREGFARMLEMETDITVVGQASNSEEAVQLTRDLNPDVILMDIRLQGKNGIETTRLIKEENSHVEVVILSMYDEDEYVFEAVKAGAQGYVLKDISREDLLRTIHVVYSGESLIQPSLARKVLREFTHLVKESASPRATAPRQLSAREVEVLQLVASGKSNKEIASLLTISERTVKAHLRTVFRKLEVSDRAQAVAYAMRKGLVE